ncbi:MAG: aldo/keto reductase [Candidatus Omnitrophica bacterium]|nr:aldo/keto reductase [Candidatus Omnitrophota bacterium]
MAGNLFRRILTRREFVRLGLLAAAGAAAGSWIQPLRRVFADAGPIPTRFLGNTGANVTIVGMGGEGTLRTWGRQAEAAVIVQRALDLGITYFDTAPAYSGSQDYYGAVLGERRRGVFLASKTHDRTRDGSLRLLDESLRRLRTDRLDLWQLHNLNEVEELEAIFGRGGAIHALEEAQRDGRVRFVGVTGHYDPAVLVEAIRRYRFDTVLASLNAADRHRLSFIDRLLPEAVSRGVGVIGMKVVAKGALLRPGGIATMQEALGYVLSLPISTAIIGFQTAGEVEDAVRIARGFEPLPSSERARLEARAAPYAEDANWFKRPA